MLAGAQTCIRSLLCFEMRAIGAVLLHQHLDVVAGLSTDADPVIQAFALQNGASIGLGAHRVVVAEFFDYAAIARLALINCTDSEERPVGASHHFHSDSYGHVSLGFEYS